MKEIIELYEVLEKIVVSFEQGNVKDAEILIGSYRELSESVYSKMPGELRKKYGDCFSVASGLIEAKMGNSEVDDPFAASKRFRKIEDPRK